MGHLEGFQNQEVEYGCNMKQSSNYSGRGDSFSEVCLEGLGK